MWRESWVILPNYIMKKNLNNALKSAREKVGITQAILAEKLGMSSSTIGMYEQGRRCPNYDTLLKLCEALGCSIYDVFSENEISNKGKIFNLDAILKNLVRYLSSKNDVFMNGKILSKQKKDSIAYMLTLIINDK